MQVQDERMAVAAGKGEGRVEQALGLAGAGPERGFAGQRVPERPAVTLTSASAASARTSRSCGYAAATSDIASA